MASLDPTFNIPGASSIQSINQTDQNSASLLSSSSSLSASEKKTDKNAINADSPNLAVPLLTPEQYALFIQANTTLFSSPIDSLDGDILSHDNARIQTLLRNWNNSEIQNRERSIQEEDDRMSDALFYLNLQQNRDRIQDKNEDNQINFLVYALQLSMQQVCLDFLDKWIEGIKKIDDERRKKDMDPLRQALEDYRKDLKSGKVDEDGAPAVVSLMIISATFTGTVGTLAVDLGPTASNLISDAISPLQPFLPPETSRLQMEWIGCLLAQATATLTAIPILMSGNASSPMENKSKDQSVANAFALQVAHLVNNESFNQFIMTDVIAKTPNSQTLPESTKKQLAAIIKFMFLALSLGLVYKAEFKHITGQEIKDLINGSLPPNNPIQELLVKLIHEQLKYASPRQEQSLLNAFCNFFDTNPKLEILLDPGKAFLNIGKQFSAELTSKSPI